MSVTRFVPAPTTAAVTAIALALTSKRHGSSARVQALKKLIAVLLVLNWRSFPMVWHLKLWGLVPWIRWRVRTRGPERALAIGQSPFDAKVITKGFVSLDLADWNGHMSNSSYAKSLDKARFKWLLQATGPAFGVEQVWQPLANTSYWFKQEIPIFAHFEMEVHICAWDDKWVYYVARFTTAPKKGSKERTLNCLALSRSCFKMKGSRLSIPPARVFAISGLGPDGSNWSRTMQLRKDRKSRDWLKYGGMLASQKAGKLPPGVIFEENPDWDETGMECYEDRRLAGLKIVERFSNPEGWDQL
ncbi:hypothetical protein OIO90_006577 [Microbotryomycetes sp. JL221]|nr:hypothetical protein OIO90_006577 [Microbotryomycetes sp. JL221]